MADDVRVTNWPNADGSEAAAAVKLWDFLRTQDGGPTTIDEHLLLYRRCRAAVLGNRDPNEPDSSGGRSRIASSNSSFY
jgi:hypothetical protein